MNRRALLLAVTGGLLAALRAAEAQQAGRPARIGLLATGGGKTDPLTALEQGLRGLGYVEGQNLLVERRFADGKLDRLPGLAAQLVRLPVDLIVASDPPAIEAATRATRTIPIVMRASDDPAAAKLVLSLAHPGGNVTGLYSFAAELDAKRLEILKEAAPEVTRVAVLWNSTSPRAARRWRDTERAARALGLQLKSLDVQHREGLEEAFRVAAREKAGALITLRNPVVVIHHREVADLAIKHRLPSMYDERTFVEAAGLMSYGADLADLYRRAAVYVDRILKGAHPGDLPVQQPTKFELVINLKTAKALGLTIPPSLLQRADQVIE